MLIHRHNLVVRTNLTTIIFIILFKLGLFLSQLPSSYSRVIVSHFVKFFSEKEFEHMTSFVTLNLFLKK